MSALPVAPPTATLDLREARLQPMRVGALAQVMAIENAVYPWPWSEGNIADSVRAGYQCLQLVAARAS